jgi:hypothetical protein
LCRWKEADLQTAVTCGRRDIHSSNQTPMFLAVLEQETLSSPITMDPSEGLGRYRKIISVLQFYPVVLTYYVASINAFLQYRPQEWTFGFKRNIQLSIISVEVISQVIFLSNIPKWRSIHRVLVVSPHGISDTSDDVEMRACFWPSNV